MPDRPCDDVHAAPQKGVGPPARGCSAPAAACQSDPGGSADRLHQMGGERGGLVGRPGTPNSS
eukprot:3686234-Rhodomonas_salina.1